MITLFFSAHILCRRHSRNLYKSSIECATAIEISLFGNRVNRKIRFFFHQFNGILYFQTIQIIVEIVRARISPATGAEIILVDIGDTYQVVTPGIRVSKKAFCSISWLSIFMNLA